jgi:hypothetical protein
MLRPNAALMGVSKMILSSLFLKGKSEIHTDQEIETNGTRPTNDRSAFTHDVILKKQKQKAPRSQIM